MLLGELLKNVRVVSEAPHYSVLIPLADGTCTVAGKSRNVSKSVALRTFSECCDTVGLFVVDNRDKSVIASNFNGAGDFVDAYVRKV